MAEQWSVPGYTEVRELGSGASGRVVHAVHDVSGAPVAIKYLSARLLTDSGWRARFRGEARLLAGLRDDNLVRFHEFVEQDDGAAIVMELVDGVTLKELLSRSGRMAPEPALTLLKGSLLGLAAAHGVGVVHRDYKPANVMVDATGWSKLVDFGVAVPAGARTAIAGTLAYLAPEQWAGWPPAPAGDVYAATTVFFECLTGKRPFHERESDGDLARVHQQAPVPLSAVPEPVRPLVAAGLAKHPAQRPPSAAEFVRQLESVATQAYGEEWESRGRRGLAGLAAALTALFPLAAYLASGGGGALSGAAAIPAGPLGSSLPAATKPWWRKAGAALAAAGAVTAGTVVVINTVDEDPPPAATKPTSPAPSTSVDPFGGLRACDLYAAAATDDFEAPQQGTAEDTMVDHCSGLRAPGNGMGVTLFATAYTDAVPTQDGEQTRINGRRAELFDNTGPPEDNDPGSTQNCLIILDLTDKASAAVGVDSGPQDQFSIDECADALRFATVVEELLPPPR